MSDFVVAVAEMAIADAKKYHDYARECLKLAEQADTDDIRQRLVELSRTWLEAALREEGLVNLDGLAQA